MLHKIKYFIRSKLSLNSLFLINKGEKSKSVYLTFDDGPVPEVTLPLLDLLDKYDVKATFFIIGECPKNHPDIIKTIHNKGHKIANHTYTSPPFHKITIKQNLNEILKTNILIEQTINEKFNMFRAPEGRWDIKLLLKLFQLKITAIHWSTDSMDFLKEPSAKIVNRFELVPIKPGDILLSQDNDLRCLEALDVLIPKWKSQGFQSSALEL